MNYYNKYLKYKKKYLNLQNAGYLNIKNYNCASNNDIKNNLNNLKDENYNITCLNLSLRSINGQIPANIINLFSNLTILDLSYNRLDGNIPEINLDKLIYLNLSNNNIIEYLINIRNLTNLQYLNISNNYINGTLEYLSNLSNLEYLNISNNNLNGPISNYLEKLIILEYLDISSNKITGNFPEYFINFFKLKYLNITETELTGIIPNSIYNLASLDEFYFNLEKFDYKFKINCNYTIKNYIGSCWNLALIMIFFMGDNTSTTIIDFFTNNKNSDQYQKYIENLDIDIDIQKIYKSMYYDSTQQLNQQLIKELSIPELIEIGNTQKNRMITKTAQLANIKNEIILETNRNKYKPHINKFIFNYNISIIADFIKQLSNRLKLLNIEIPNDKKYILEPISEYTVIFKKIILFSKKKYVFNIIIKTFNIL